MRIAPWWIGGLCLGLALMGPGEDCWGQARPKAPAGGGGAVGAGSGPIRIREITGEGRRGLVRTPEYSTSSPRGKTEGKFWTQVTVVFDTEPEWIDELLLQYHVLCYNAKNNEYMLFRGSVSHVDVKAGRSHQGSIFVRPSLLDRYGEVIGVAVEIVYRGEMVAAKSAETGKPKLPPEWWKNEKVPMRDNYLLGRDKTPFAFVNYDEYEATR